MPDTNETKHLSTGEWFLTQLVIALPLIGLIMLFVWAFGGGNTCRRNYCRAVLLWMLVGFGLAILVGLGFLFLTMVAGLNVNL